MRGFLAADDVCHDLGRDRCQQDAVAEVACGDVVAGNVGCAEDGQSVGGTGAEPGPVFEDFGFGQFGNKFYGGMMKPLDCFGDGTLVESSLFYRSSNEEASVAARD